MQQHKFLLRHCIAAAPHLVCDVDALVVRTDDLGLDPDVIPKQQFRAI